MKIRGTLENAIKAELRASRRLMRVARKHALALCIPAYVYEKDGEKRAAYDRAEHEIAWAATRYASAYERRKALQHQLRRRR